MSNPLICFAIKSFIHNTDAELLDLIRLGDREAFEEVYKRYWVKLYKVAVRKIQSGDEAEDIIQDLFVSLWLKRETLKINFSLNTYLFSALKYKIINHIEANIVRRDYLKSLNGQMLKYDNSAVESIIFRDTSRQIEAGINKLSPKVKLVFQLSRKEHLSIEEIAERLDVSKQTVKNQMGKALKALKTHLGLICWTLFFLTG